MERNYESEKKEGEISHHSRTRHNAVAFIQSAQISFEAEKEVVLGRHRFAAPPPRRHREFCGEEGIKPSGIVVG